MATVEAELFRAVQCRATAYNDLWYGALQALQK